MVLVGESSFSIVAGHALCLVEYTRREGHELRTLPPRGEGGEMKTPDQDILNHTVGYH